MVKLSSWSWTLLDDGGESSWALRQKHREQAQPMLQRFAIRGSAKRNANGFRSGPNRKSITWNDGEARLPGMHAELSPRPAVRQP